MTASKALAAATTPNQKRAVKQARVFKEPTQLGEVCTAYEDGKPVEVSSVVDARPGELAADEKAAREVVKKLTGLTFADDREVLVAEVRTWGENPNTGEPYTYVRYVIRDRQAAQAAAVLDLDAFRRPLPRRPRVRAVRPSARGLHRVVVAADPQLTKQDWRGGSDEAVERFDEAMTLLLEEAERVPTEAVVGLSGGDWIEGFESTSSEMFTNDASHPDSLLIGHQVAGRFVDTLNLISADTTVAAVPSNHSSWRRGKDQLGRPGDDYELLIWKLVARDFHRAKVTGTRFVFPATPWDVSLALRVGGSIIGLNHGHMARGGANAIPRWLQAQFAGDGPLAACDIVVTGHYHHLRCESVGRVTIDGRSRDRTWIQAPAMDSGSSWFANGSGGSDSDPGIVTFLIDEDGWTGDLKVLRPRRGSEAAAA